MLSTAYLVTILYYYDTYSLDIGAEEVVLIISSSCTTPELASKVPEDSARYHLYRFKHTHQGDYRESNGEG